MAHDFKNQEDVFEFKGKVMRDKLNHKRGNL